MVVVVVGVGVLGGADVLHLVDGTTFRAALDRAFTRGLARLVSGCTSGGSLKAEIGKSRRGRTYSQPDGDVGVGGRASAAAVLLIAERLDDDGVFERAYCGTC